MTDFEVDSIIDGATFTVKGGWCWKTHSGTQVRPLGYDAPKKGEPGYLAIKAKLEKLILGRVVHIDEIRKVDKGRLIAEVFFEGVSLAEFFPQSKWE